MEPQTIIEFPAVGATYHHNAYGVYRYDEYPESSVNAGRERRSSLGLFDTLEEAREAFPEATFDGGSNYTEFKVPETAPAWFDPTNAGERWDDEY